jgi:hypothetical protein
MLDYVLEEQTASLAAPEKGALDDTLQLETDVFRGHGSRRRPIGWGGQSRVRQGRLGH